MDRRKERKNKLSVKQWICLALVAVMLLGVLPIAAFAADDEVAPLQELNSVEVQAGSFKSITLSQSVSSSTRFNVTATDSDGKTASGFNVSVSGRNSIRLSVGRNVAPGTYNVTIQYGTNTDIIQVTVKEATSSWPGMPGIPGGTSYPLEMQYYNPNSELYYEVFELRNGNKVAGNQSTIQSVTLNGTAVSGNESEARALSNYYPGISNGATTGGLTKDLVITPTKGYYVVEVVIACCSTQFNNDPYQCQTWAYGNAFRAEFTISDSASSDHSVTIKDLHAKNFGHMSYPYSEHYAIAIRVAPVPTPLYVAYEPGTIADVVPSAFDGNDWTAANTGNVYGVGKMENTTHFEYAYNEVSEVASWKHYANSITNEAVAAAAAAGYYFTGWKLEYFTTVDASSGDYVFSNPYGTGDANRQADEEVNLVTNVRLTAQWEPMTLAVKKEVAGLPAGTSTTHEIQVQKLNGENWTAVKTLTFNVTGNTTSVAQVVNVTPGTYRVVETNAATVDGYVVSIADGQQAVIGSDAKTATLTVKNTYSQKGILTVTKVIEGVVPTVDMTYNFQVKNADGNVVAEAVVTVKAGQTTGSAEVELAAGNYTVTENVDDVMADIGIYEWKECVNAEPVTVETGKNTNATITNRYVPKLGGLTLTKRLGGVLTAESDAAAFTFEIKNAQNEVVQTMTVKAGETTDEIELPIGEYTITEVTPQNVEIENYVWQNASYKVEGQDLAVTGNDVKVTVNESAVTEVTCTNLYKHAMTEVKVTKYVTGNMGDINKKFAFQISYVDEHGQTQTMSAELANNGSVTVPAAIGTDITITEESGVYTATYKVNGGDATAATVENFCSSATVTVADGMEVEFTNDYNITIDTGVELEVLPFVILLVIAGGALVLMNRKRLF